MFFNDHSIIYIIFYLYCGHNITRYYMVLSWICHIILFKENISTTWVLYYIIIIIISTLVLKTNTFLPPGM